MFSVSIEAIEWKKKETKTNNMKLNYDYSLFLNGGLNHDIESEPWQHRFPFGLSWIFFVVVLFFFEILCLYIFVETHEIVIFFFISSIIVIRLIANVFIYYKCQCNDYNHPSIRSLIIDKFNLKLIV